MAWPEERNRPDETGRTDGSPVRILWIAPNLNHYKIRFLNRLLDNERLRITVLAGASMRKLGHHRATDAEKFDRVDVSVAKDRFQWNTEVYKTLWRTLAHTRFDAVLMPIEKKHLLVILYVFILKYLRRYRLFSYNHPVTRSGIWGRRGDRILTRLLFTMYDRIVFYTREGMEWALAHDLLPKEKARWANNTIDTAGIREVYRFEVNSAPARNLLFIGRLIPNKRLGRLFEYYRRLKTMLPEVSLNIIGDGPEAREVQTARAADDSIRWQGALTDEREISAHMRTAHLVFVPGWSGLSIVHAFAYGKPYVTLRGGHPPEIDYLKDGENGLLLDGEVTHDCERLVRLLTDPDAYARMCRAAYEKSLELSVENWCAQVAKAFLDERTE